MLDFMEKATQIWSSGQAGWATQQFKCVFDARRKLQAAYAKSHVNIDNIEDLFATVEMAKLIGCLAGLPEETTLALPSHLRHLIMRTLEQSIRFPLYDEEQVVGGPTPYNAFVELLVQMQKSRNLKPVTVISFNYDLALDYALTVRGLELDYGLDKDSKKENKANVVTVLKPHGSLNWLINKSTNEVEPYRIQPLDPRSYRRRLGVYDLESIPIDTMELLHGPDAWGEKPVPEPMIVPPTWSKGQYQETLVPVWRSASQSLGAAENIFVIGYSLPPSDHFFRAFFALSTITDTIIERFWLFDPSDISPRFQSLLGPAINHREKFRHERVTFLDAIMSLARSFELDEDQIRLYLK